MDFINTLCMLVGLSFLSSGLGFFWMNNKQKNQSTPYTASVHRYTEKQKKNGTILYYPVFRFQEGMRTRLVPYNYGYKTKPFELEQDVEVLYHPTNETIIIPADKTNRNLTLLFLVIAAILFALAFSL